MDGEAAHSSSSSSVSSDSSLFSQHESAELSLLSLDTPKSNFGDEAASFVGLNFGARCAKCCRSIGAADWVRRARDRVYHLACFACDACKRQLSTGEEFALHDNRVLCKQHYLESIEGGATSNDGYRELPPFPALFASNRHLTLPYQRDAPTPTHCTNLTDSMRAGLLVPENTDGEGSQRKSKRVRTTFTDEQLQVLQANFQIDSNPDSQDLERIAQLTGLSKRVTQVWFQNSRARQKKHMSSKKHQQGRER
ncbi:LIM/homeobox protein Awh-like 1 [Homarus americanus]|uniref:LIM/homeobox protein Awh-like 1 n=1 Tax=Homarus americanus TaxID=6706 RepID=A0A8J5NEN3_HOMAM|nr:LIM/homeobox protein Awh-like 1 [Homarus americanus]